jgi:hypothetical protein
MHIKIIKPPEELQGMYGDLIRFTIENGKPYLVIQSQSSMPRGVEMFGPDRLKILLKFIKEGLKETKK